MARAHRTGRLCESLAASALERDGWSILARNFRDGPREIDLIARRGELVAFIEVKGRTDTSHHHPLEAIGPFKRRDLARAARLWIAAHGRRGDLYRFDAVSVIGPRSTSPRVEHVEDAWRM